MKGILFISKNNFSGMKKTTVFICFIILSPFLFSQSVLPTRLEIDAFFNSKTLVVLESGIFSTYNIEIKDAFEKYWNLTPYDFINNDEFKEKMSDSTYSFLVLTQSHYEKDKKNIHYNFLNLLLGAKHTSLSELPEMASLPLSYFEGDEENYGFKLGVIVRFFQKRAMELKEKGSISSMKYLTYYNDFASQIKTKKLFIYEGNLQPKLRSLKAIKEYYKYDVEIVSSDALSEIVSQGADDIYFLHFVGPEGKQRSGRCFKMIFGLSDANMVYFNKHNISEKKPAGLLPSDFKRINR